MGFLNKYFKKIVPSQKSVENAPPKLGPTSVGLERRTGKKPKIFLKKGGIGAYSATSCRSLNNKTFLFSPRSFRAESSSEYAVSTCRSLRRQNPLHKPTMAIGYSLRMCARHVDSTSPGRSNLVFRSKPIAEAEMSNRLMANKPFHSSGCACVLGRVN